MKMKSVKFEGQLSGQVKKEAYFGALRKKAGIKLPKVGEFTEAKLPSDELTGAFLSILDGRNSLTVNGEKVSKIKVYSGETKIPCKFALSFKVNRVSDTACKLSANIQG